MTSFVERCATLVIMANDKEVWWVAIVDGDNMPLMPISRQIYDVEQMLVCSALLLEKTPV